MNYKIIKLKNGDIINIDNISAIKKDRVYKFDKKAIYRIIFILPSGDKVIEKFDNEKDREDLYSQIALNTGL